MKSCVKLLLNIQKLGFCDSQEFPKELSKLLVSSNSFIACSFYTINTNAKCLILRGQFGFKYEDYTSFKLPMNSIVGIAYNNGKISFNKDISTLENFHEKKFILKYDLHEVITIPLCGKCTEIENQTLDGVVSIYPKDDSKSIVFEILKELQHCISIAYLQSIERTKSLVKDKIEHAISSSRDINSALHRTLQYLTNELNIEASSIFIFNDKLKSLKLHATTGIDQNKDLNKNYIFYKKNESQYSTWKSFNESRTIVSLKSDIIKEKYLESTCTEIESMMIIPIIKKRHHFPTNKTIGVLRIVNKLLIHNNERELISFTKEDIEILNYVCGIISQAIHMFLNRENRVEFVENLMHGTKSNIGASIENIDILERRVDLSSILPSDLLFTLNDTKQWLFDIKNQMDRIDYLNNMKLTLNNDHHVLNSLKIVRKYFINSARASDIKSFFMTKLYDNEFDDIPDVIADSNGIATVFRNLVENTLKYRNYNINSCEINLHYILSNEYVNIYFKDNGIGIPKGDEEDIFEEGFRSTNGIIQEPSSTGIGLAQSKELMRLMGGDLILESILPTTFNVKLRIGDL